MTKRAHVQPSGPRGPFAVVAMLVACALLVGQGLSLWHRAAVVHVRCAHGELVHVDVHGGDRPVHDAASTGVMPGDVAPSVHDHEHCAGGVFLSAAFVSQERAARDASVGIGSVVLAPSPAVHVPSDICGFAPKTSPPFVAS